MTTAMPDAAAEPARPINIGAPMLVANVDAPIFNKVCKPTYDQLRCNLLMYVIQVSSWLVQYCVVTSQDIV